MSEVTRDCLKGLELALEESASAGRTYGFDWLSSAQVSALLAEREALKRMLRSSVRTGLLAIGDHFAPNDCYATGPLTGDPFADLLVCPACSALAEYKRIEAALMEPAPLPQHRPPSTPIKLLRYRG